MVFKEQNTLLILFPMFIETYFRFIAREKEYKIAFRLPLFYKKMLKRIRNNKKKNKKKK